MVRDDMNDLRAGPLPVSAVPAHPRARREGPEPGAGLGRGGVGRSAAGAAGLPATGGRPRSAAHRERGVMDELRRKGLAKMNEVYGWEMPNIEGDPYFDLTVDHLFGTIWTPTGTVDARQAHHDADRGDRSRKPRPGRDPDQRGAAQRGTHRDRTARRWRSSSPTISAFRWVQRSTARSTRVVAKRKKAAAKGAGEDKKANVESALKMHSGE